MFIHPRSEIIGHFNDWNLNDEAKSYLDFHSHRFEFLLKTIDHFYMFRMMDKPDEPYRILDVGPGFITQFMRDRSSHVIIDSLGFEDERFLCRKQDRHFRYDLNNIKTVNPPEINGYYDLIIMAEVIEHLSISPRPVINFISSLMDSKGFFIVQTPNACALPKRLRMLFGKNPYEMLREPYENPGHIREYTRKELIRIFKECGLKLTSEKHANYFKDQTTYDRIFRKISPYTPSSWRYGMTMNFKKR